MWVEIKKIGNIFEICKKNLGIQNKFNEKRQDYKCNTSAFYKIE